MLEQASKQVTSRRNEEGTNLYNSTKQLFSVATKKIGCYFGFVPKTNAVVHAEKNKLNMSMSSVSSKQSVTQRSRSSRKEGMLLAEQEKENVTTSFRDLSLKDSPIKSAYKPPVIPKLVGLTAMSKTQ